MHVRRDYAALNYALSAVIGGALATGDADSIRISYTEHAVAAEGDLQICEIDALTGQILTGQDPF